MTDPTILSRLRREMAALRQRQGQMRADLLALSAERERYATIYDDLPLPALTLDARGRIVAANTAAARQWQAGAGSDLVGRSVYSLFSGRGRLVLFDALRAGRRGQPAAGARTVQDLALRQQDGRLVAAEAHLAAPRRRGDGAEETLLVVVARPDVSTHARERSLYRALIDSFDSMIFAFDLDGRCLLANSAIAQELGTSRAALLAGILPPTGDTAHVFGARDSDREVLASAQPGAFYTSHVGARRRSFRIDKFPLRDDDGTVFGIGGITSDLSDQMEWQAALRDAVDRAERLTYHDPLTHLPNRTYLSKVIDSLTHQVPMQPFSLMIIDAVDLKLINNSHGLRAGDAFLQTLGARLEALTDRGGFAAHLGGSEFALILRGPADEGTLEKAAQLRASLSEPVALPAGALRRSTCAIGVASCPHDGTTAEDLIRVAGVALLRAKSRGRGGIARFEPELLETVDRRSRLIDGLHRVLEANGFRVAFQPKFALAGDGQVVGAEALLRWSDSGLGEVGPDEFIALAERIGLVPEIDRAMVALVFAQLGRWERAGRRLHMAINVSALSLASAGFAAHVLDQLRTHRLDARRVLFEITETALMEIGGGARQCIDALRGAGIEFSIDDFGTGYSSLRYLQELPLREVKIDRSFVAGIGTEARRDEQLVAGILSLARSFGLRSVAEGVETGIQFDWLRRAGCDQAQGFYLSHPLPADAFAERYLAAA